MTEFQLWLLAVFLSSAFWLKKDENLFPSPAQSSPDIALKPHVLKPGWSWCQSLPGFVFIVHIPLVVHLSVIKVEQFGIAFNHFVPPY